jgi:hypothetical protein
MPEQFFSRLAHGKVQMENGGKKHSLLSINKKQARM